MDELHTLNHYTTPCNQQVNMASNQTPSGNQITSGDLNNVQVQAARLNNIKTFMKQFYAWRLNIYNSISCVDSSDESKTSSPNRSMEDLLLDTPPFIIIDKPNLPLESIPISPGFLDNTPSLPSESDQSVSDQSVSDQSVLNDSTPIENN